MRRLWDWRVLAVVPTIALCAVLTAVGEALDSYAPRHLFVITFFVPLTAGSRGHGASLRVVPTTCRGWSLACR